MSNSTLESASPIKQTGKKPNAKLPLGEQLVQANLITETELEAALRLQTEKGKRIGESLLELGLITEDELVPFIEKQLGIPCVRLREGLIDPKVVKTLPHQIAKRIGAIALFSVRGELTVAMAEPQNLGFVDELERVSQLRVRPVFTFASSVNRIIDRVYQDNFEVDAITADFGDSDIELNQEADDDLTAIESIVDGSPIVNLVNFLVLQAVKRNASDIHIEAGLRQTIVRFRIDGQLVEALRPKKNLHSTIVSRIKVMAKLDIAEQRTPQDGRVQIIALGKTIDLRVSTVPTVLGEKVVIRVLDKSRLSFNLDKLGVAENNLVKIKRLLAKPHGLLLVTGPTGSGKTTTLYSALELIKSVHTNIVTVEDPVEYQLELINQIQTDKSRNLTFATALRAILRQDPDVVMLGEIRDAETAEIAVQAALTGHLVLSTLHTNDSVSAVTRLQDMGVAPYKISASLAGVIAQRLVRNVCPHCRTTHFPPADTLKMLNYQGNVKQMFSIGDGCTKCFDTGFKGRTGIYEVLEVDSKMKRLITSQDDIEVLRDHFMETGGTTLLQSGIQLAEEQVTSLDEVTRIAFSG